MRKFISSYKGDDYTHSDSLKVAKSTNNTRE